MASSTSPEPPGAVEGSVSHPSICDYEGSAYRTDFWTQDRSYEDAAERIALEALLPPAGRRLIEIGAGFGRLADLYAGYEQVILFDYSRSLLQEARAQWGEHGHWDDRAIFTSPRTLIGFPLSLGFSTRLQWSVSFTTRQMFHAYSTASARSSPQTVLLY
jgi:hypothetical protein